MKKDKLIGSFKLGSTEWKILEKECSERNTDIEGTTFGIRKVIEVYNKVNIQSSTDQSKRETIHHEVVHSILQTMGRFDLDEDEVFVQNFSVFMKQFFDTYKEEEEQ